MRLEIFIILSLLFVATACRGNVFLKLENELSDKALDYYETYLKGSVIGVTKHKITLSRLEEIGIDISNFIDKDCDKESHALIILENNNNNNYDIEVYLECKNYQTENN